MADTKISALTELAEAPADNDVLAIVDTSATATKKIQASNLKSGLQRKVFYTVGPADADYITDGTADEVQIQQAIDAANTAGGGVVYLKEGTYTLTNAASASIVMKSKVTLQGDGINRTIIVAGGDTELSNNSRSVGIITTASPGFPAASTVKTTYTDMVVQDMTVKSRNGGYGITFFNSTNVAIRNVEQQTTNVGGSPLIKAGLYTLHCDRVWIENCYVHDTHGNGININSVDNFWVRNNRVYNTYDDGIDVDFDFGESNAVYSNYGVVSGNVVDTITNGGVCIRVENSHYVTVTGNDVTPGSPTNAGEGIWIGCYDAANKTCTNVTVANNNVYNCQNIGIHTECTNNASGATVAEIIIEGNNIYDCGDNAGSDVRGGIVHAAQVLSGSRVLIQGNRIHTVSKQTDSGGIVIYKQGRVVVKNNLVENAPYGIHLWNGDAAQTYSDVFIQNNNVHATTTNYFGASSVYTQAGVTFDLGGPIGTGNSIKDENGNEQIKFSTTASAVNELTITNAATSNAPQLSATGGDTNIDLKLRPKGSGVLNLNSNILFENAKDIQWNSGGTMVFKAGSTSSNFSMTSWNGSIDYQWIYMKSDGLIGFGNAAPSARIHITEATVGNEIFRLESTATNDDPNYKIFQGRVATTDGTPTTINTIAIPASTTVMIEARVVARRTGGTAGSAEDGAGYVVRGCYKNSAGSATIIGSVNADFTAESQSTWAATFNTSSGNVLLQVTGAANNNVTWHSTVIVQSLSS
jgi:hypothetical protein